MLEDTNSLDAARMKQSRNNYDNSPQTFDSGFRHFPAAKGQKIKQSFCFFLFLCLCLLTCLCSSTYIKAENISDLYVYIASKVKHRLNYIRC